MSLTTSLDIFDTMNATLHSQRGQELIFMRKNYHVVWIVLSFLLVGIPAYGYGDPTGGALFQILMPTLAAIWATWMIFANRVRQLFSTVYRKLRGAESEESGS
jgi:hypothetical protein